MKPLDEVTISIVAYNSRATLSRQQNVLRQLNRVIVVDNGSQDGTSAWLKEALPEVQCVSLAENIGFGRGHNLAVSRCQTPFALLLNPDCDIEPDAIEALADCLRRHPDALMAVPRLVYPDGRQQENHRQFFHTRARGREAYQAPLGDTCCEMVSGAVMMIRVETFRRIGGFDPWFFLYWEDEELCIRARQQRLAVVLTPEAQACHVAQTSSTPSARTTFLRHYCYTSSKIYLRRKLGETVLTLSLRGVGTFVGSLLVLIVSLVTAKPDKARRSLARMSAVLTAPWQLSRARCVPRPLLLWQGPVDASR